MINLGDQQYLIVMETREKLDNIFFQRALFNRCMWHDVSKEEVQRVFCRHHLAFKQLVSGLEVQSPNGTGIIYRIKYKEI